MDEEKNKKSKKMDKKDLEIDELKKQLEDMKNDFLRARADYENLRKRSQIEMEEVRDRAIASFALDLIPTIDNFEMSLKMTDNKEMFIKGVEMIHNNLLETLKEKNIFAFEAQAGILFNPHEHDPILIEDNSKEAGIVRGTIKKGYKFKEKIIRPARVEVVKEKENSDE